VVKAALQLLNKMVHQGIFQPPLKAQVGGGGGGKPGHLLLQVIHVQHTWN